MKILNCEDVDIKYWLALLRIEGIGCKTFANLIEDHTPEEIFTANPSELSSWGIKKTFVEAITNFDWLAVDYDLQWLAQPNNDVLKITHSLYPDLLKEIYDPPPLLFVRGNSHVLAYPQIAIVGSRNPSALGNKTAFDFAFALSQYGFAITSGLALGIDATAHQGTLSASGFTIAVAGTGLDRVYPSSNRDLALEIVNTGVMISEFPPGTMAKGSNFPRRNRIISGLCQGLLVVEAAQKSGSLITARMALEQNREVFAIPGSIYSPLSRGCNAMIREGAKLVESPQDIIDELSQYKQRISFLKSEPEQSLLDLEQQTLLNLVMFSPTSIDDLVESSSQSVESIAAQLFLLELQGHIEAIAGGCYIRVK
ncbi:MAG: DNA-processing protein DprA [Methylococcaceae bacterium]